MTNQQSQIDDLVRMVRLGLANGIDETSIYNLVPLNLVQQVKELVSARNATPLPEPAVIKGARTRIDWENQHNTADGEIWRNLRNFLLDSGKRDTDEVLALDKASDKVLFQLGSPTEAGEGLDKIKGLVVGYVQSGKTANYTALTAKAFDAGFKIVIVLAGIHNALRRQTQMRMNNELGIELDSNERKTARKHDSTDATRITVMTAEDAINGDFKYSNISSSVLSSGRFLFVTKKNASILEKLIKWIGNAGVDLPTLVIDDEADQATINTRGSVSITQYEEFEGDSATDLDIDPTRINELIRKLLGKFRNVSYVGYTATPYANVFITHDASHSVLQDDLYPKNFIISLPKPNGYMGPEEFFGSSITGEKTEGEDFSSSIIKIVPHDEVDEVEQLDANKRSPSGDLNVPLQLKSAIQSFILATAAKRVFDGAISPTSMLIHASHLRDRQKEIAKLTQEFVDDLRTNWRYDKASHIEEWKSVWLSFTSDFQSSKYKFSFEELEPTLNEILGRYSPLPVLLLNYSSDDELDYESDPNLTAIVIGGNKLSRGLTLEGLLISYFVRKASAPKADTLTQMGRFFGFRSHIANLTRIYTTDELRSMFIEISLVELALRRELENYQRDGKTPKDYAPRVKARSLLMPTARNKMRGAIIQGISYSGDLVQTTSFPKEQETPRSRNLSHLSKLKVNLDETCGFVSKLLLEYGPPQDVTPGIQTKTEDNTLRLAKWVGIPARAVVDYLNKYFEIDGATRFVPKQITQYISDLSSRDQPELTEWTVAIVGRTMDMRLGVEDFGTGMRFGRIERALSSGSEVSIGALVNPVDLNKKTGDELLDFDAEAIDAITVAKTSSPNVRTSELIRAARPKTRALLTIYPISPESIGSPRPNSESNSSAGKNQDLSLGSALFGTNVKTHTIVGLAISFPESEEASSAYWTQET